MTGMRGPPYHQQFEWKLETLTPFLENLAELTWNVEVGVKGNDPCMLQWKELVCRKNFCLQQLYGVVICSYI